MRRYEEGVRRYEEGVRRYEERVRRGRHPILRRARRGEEGVSRERGGDDGGFS